MIGPDTCLRPAAPRSCSLLALLVAVGVGLVAVFFCLVFCVCLCFLLLVFGFSLFLFGFFFGGGSFLTSEVLLQLRNGVAWLDAIITCALYFVLVPKGVDMQA